MTPKNSPALALLAVSLVLVLLLVLAVMAVTAQGPEPSPAFPTQPGPGMPISEQALRAQQASIGSVSGASVTGIGGWTPLGGPIAPGGQINALTVHPAIPGTVYAAVAEPGSIDTGDSRIYKTEDSAASWTLVFEPDRLIHALAVTGTNVYAGAINPGGEGPCLYVSHDGGATWTESLSFPDRGAWIDIEADPADPDVALAGGWLSHGGGWFRDHGLVYRTDDAGATWSELLDVGDAEQNLSFNAVLISPHEPDLLLAALRRDDGDSTVYRSVDGGATWDEAYAIGGASIVSLAAHDSDPLTFYAGAAGFTLSWGPSKVFRSTDAGITWEEVLPDGGGYLAFEPPSTVYAAADQLWASTSNGDPGSWELRSGVPHGPGSFAADLGTSPATLYAGNYGPGVSKSVDGGYGWEECNNGILSLVDVYDLDVDPMNPDRLFVAAWYAGAWRSEDAGGTWSQVLEPWPWTFAINPADGNTLYAGGWSCWDGIIWHTDDGGASFDPAYSPPFFEPDCSGGDAGILDLAVAPSMPNVVYGGGWVDPRFEAGQAFVVRSPDGGLSWTEVLSGPAGYDIQTLAIDPLDHQVVYAGGWGCDGSCEGMIYRTTNGGGTWETVLSSPDDEVRSIVVDYQQPSIVFAATRLAKVYKSSDAGNTWDLILPQYTGGDRLAIDPNDHNRIYVAGGGDIAESPDGGQTWYPWPLSNGAPNIHLGALTVDAGTPVQTLYAGWSGVWAYTRAAPSLGDRYVATTGDDELNNCTDPNSPCQTVGYALLQANPGETVQVAAGTYLENLSAEKQVILEGGYSGPPDWTRDPGLYETVLDGSGDPTLPGDWDGEYIHEPSVLHNGGEYEMWYTGSDMFGEDYVGHAAGTPSSWSKSPENPLLDDHQAFVRLDDGQYRMWYMRPGTECIWTAWSDDGLAWNEDPDPCLCPPWDGSWESDSVRDPSVTLDGDDTYWMFYEGWNWAEPHPVQIGCATSTDGLTWVRCAENPLLSPGPEAWDEAQAADPAVLFDGTTFHMWYAGLALDGTWSIGYATSPDGVTWAKDEGNPVLEPTPDWWDQGSVAQPTAWFDGVTYHLWYVSNSVIAHAESADGTTWTKDIEPALSPGWYGEWGKSVMTFGEGSDGSVLDGFTVTGGDACGGGGVKVQGVEATIRDCLVRDNVSLAYCGGGGVSVRESSGFATILGSEIRHNEASDGGGLDVRGGAGALVSETLVYSNTARWGGGLLVDNGSSASVVGSEVQENAAADSGGGIDAWWPDTTLVISDTWVGGNTTQGNGGGVHATNGVSVLMQGATLEGNTAQGWGGGLAGYGSILTLTDVTVEQNVALSGEAGGLLFMNDGTTVTLTHVAIIENEAGGGGAGLNLSGGPVATLRDVEIARNLAPWGAGLRLYEARLTGDQVSIVENIATDNMHAAFQVDAQSAMTLTNSLITGNEGGNAGLMTFTSTLSLTNVTVAGNSPGYSWGGIAISDHSSASMQNSILYANGDGDLTCDGTSTCTVEYSDLEHPWAGDGNISADPMFVDPASGDYHLQAGSPCIDTASAAYAPDHDIDGESRPYDGDGSGTAEPDMGADEYHDPATPEGDRYVAKTGSDGTSTCTDPGAPCLTVGHALNQVNPTETIFVAEGTYLENLLVEEQVTLEGGYSGPPDWMHDPVTYETVLDGSGDPLIPGDWDGASVLEPTVVHNGTEFEMWYTGWDMFGESRIGRATGGPTSWTKSVENPLLDGARAFVRLDGETYRMWYMQGTYDECLSTAWSDDGLVWHEEPEARLCPWEDPSWPLSGIGDPSIVVDGGGTYWMYYEGYAGTMPQPDRIGCATSPDGLTWSPCTEGVVLTPDAGAWDAGMVTDPMVMLDGSEFRMWYSGRDSDGNWAIGYATSSDGVTWTKYAGNPVMWGTPSTWDEGGVGNPEIWFDGVTLHMWYSSPLYYYPPAMEGSRIGYAISSDGLAWTKHPDPVLEPGWFGHWGAPVVSFQYGSSASVVEGLTITGGDGQAGIVIEGATATVSNCTVIENESHTYVGSGIDISSAGAAQIEHTRIFSNTGVGLAVRGSSAASLLNSTVSHNASDGPGGGINLQYSATLLARDSLISYNTGSYNGGLYVGLGSSARLERTDVLSNTGGTIGGGIWMRDNTSSLEFLDSLLQGNSAHYAGGGIHAEDGSVILEGVTLRGNWLESGGEGGYGGGGGLAFWKGAVVTITNVLIEGNTSYSGAGLDVRSSAQVTLDGVQLLGNTAHSTATVRLLDGAHLTGDRVWIQDNASSGDGAGGVELLNGSALTLTNAFITGNSGGAGTVISGSTLSLTHVTVAGNSRADGGGGLGVSEASSATILNDILFSNGDWDLVCDGTSTCAVEYSDLEHPWAGPGNLSADPQFVDPASGDYHLQAGSPCIDTASAAYAPDHDIDGQSRPYDGDGSGAAEPDMGADEYYGEPILHDIATAGAMPIGPVTVGEPTAVRAELFNAGNQLEDGVPVSCWIEDPATAIVYQETVASGEVPAGTWAWVTFPDWTPSTAGEHTLACESALALDQDPANDLHAHSVMAEVGPRPDVWTRDNDADTGDVPTDAPWWVSPDVWMRHQPDGGLVHQNPVAFAQNTVYVRLWNRGDAAASGIVDIYASRSRLGWPCHVEAPNVGTIAFADLAPGEVRIVSLAWTPEETGHHGLQTVIDALDDPPDWSQPCSPHRPRYDNNISWKNVVVYAHPPTGAQALLAAEGAEVQIVNLYGQAKDVDLVLDWTAFPSGSSLVVTLPEDLFDRWAAHAGRWVEGLEVISATQEFVVTSPISATIGGLPMQADEVATATLTFDGWAGAEVEVNLQERIDGQLVGGATYVWIIADTVAPEVAATSPPDAATDVALDAALIISFTEEIGPLSLNLDLMPDPGGRIASWNSSGTVVTATHAGFASGTTYQATLTANDTSGNPLDAPHTWSFTTVSEDRIILWAEHVIDSSFPSAKEAQAVDVDGDGDTDAVGVSYSLDMVSWWENDGSEQFTEHPIAEDFASPQTVFAIDLDGDDDIDVLAGSQYGDRISWFENDGNESFGEHVITTSFEGVSSVRGTDLDDDGDVDILASAEFDDDIAWWENDGAEVFTKHFIDPIFDGANSAEPVDLDDDGDIDVVGAAYVADQVAWWENDGAESFTKHVIDNDFFGSGPVIAVDLDVDGDQDVVAVAYFDRELAWWENDGSEGFSKHSIYVYPGYSDNLTDVSAADIDADGDVDLMTACDLEIAWWQNEGNLTFARNPLAELTGDSVSAHDIDGDGDLDILGSNGGVRWWEQLSNAAPELAWTGEANYVADGLHPETGEPDDLFVYRVLYSDANNDPPESVQVRIEKGGGDITGSPFAMACAAGDYVSGVICSYTATGLVDGADYSYYFVGQDDQGNPAMPTDELDAPDVATTYPVLSWPGDTHYEADGLHPETGDRHEDYVYRVKYSDAGGDPPGSVQVHIEKGGADIAGSPFALSCEAGDYVSGVICSYTQAGLEEGTDYSYYFVGQDDQGHAAAPTDELDAPDVITIYRVYLPLVLVDAGPPEVAPVLDDIQHDGTGGYTVSWSSVPKATRYVLEEDEDPAFASPSVVHDGGSASAAISGRAEGTYYYRVRAANSFGTSGWSATESVDVGPPGVPTLQGINNPDGDGSYTVSWGSVPAATAYTLEEATTPTFTDAVEVYTGGALSTGISGQDLGTYYYRVRASNIFGESGWSNVESVEVTDVFRPQPGVWNCTTTPGITVRFTVSPDGTAALDGYVSISCGSLAIPGPEPIVDRAFGLLDPGGEGHISLTFDSETHGSGGYSIFKSASCWSTGTIVCSP